MAISSEYGMHSPVCDCCGLELDEEFDFYDAVNAKKAAGWHSVKEKWGWQDYCPDCYAKCIWEGDDV